MYSNEMWFAMIFGEISQKNAGGPNKTWISHDDIRYTLLRAWIGIIA